MAFQPYKLTATEVLKLLKNDTISVEMYAKSLLERIKERDSIVKAWVYLDPALVLSQARALDQVPKHQRGPLHGLAIGVKDIMNTKDMPTQFGSPIYRGYRPSADSAAVGILRAAGALIFGKTTTTEFTVLNTGPLTTNPHDPNRTPGGSSAGSAAAVADLQVTVSLGAQTGGSIIRPASFCGVFALKPTFNAISVEGQKPFAPTFDTFGFFARSSDDLRLLTDVLTTHGDDQFSKPSSLQDVTIALIKTPMWSSAGPGTVSVMQKAATLLEKSGAKVSSVAFPGEAASAAKLKRIQNIITLAEARVSFFREYETDKARLAKEIQDIVENTSNATNKEMTEALDTYSTIRGILNDLAANYSAILTPSAIDEAPVGLADMGSATFNTMWTGFHMPVINIPAFVGPNGLPVGLSLVGPRYHERHLLSISKLVEEAFAAHPDTQPDSIDLACQAVRL